MITKIESHEVPSNYIAVTPLEETDQWGVLLYHNGLLKTPAGNLVQSDSYKLMLHMVQELEEYPVLKVANDAIVEPRPLCAYLLFSTQPDFVVGDPKIEREQVEQALKHDPILHPSAGPEWTDQLRAWECIRVSHISGGRTFPTSGLLSRGVEQASGCDLESME